ncbi:hypothetical protein ACN47E_010226 [Coniothyrium glycines]
MDDDPAIADRSCSESHVFNPSEAIYGTLPSRATQRMVCRSRAPSPASPKLVAKKKPIAALGKDVAISSWLAPTSKRLRSQRIEIHQSTCLNLNMAADDSTESDLWILPDFDDWELGDDSFVPLRPQRKGAPFLRRAAKSNLDWLRAHFEGVGWAFLCGKYDEDKQVLQEEAGQSEENVDEEFDVVVLPAVQVSC